MRQLVQDSAGQGEARYRCLSRRSRDLFHQHTQVYLKNYVSCGVDRQMAELEILSLTTLRGHFGKTAVLDSPDGVVLPWETRATQRHRRLVRVDKVSE